MNELRRSRRNPIAAVVLIATAVAGAGALVALRLRFQPPVVPPYALVPALAPDDAGAQDGIVQRIVPNAAVAITIAPEAPVEGAVALRGFLLRGDEVRPWDPPFTVDRDGTIHVAGRTDALFAGVPDGPWEMAFAVGRPEVLPTAPLDVLRARNEGKASGAGASGPADAGWHLVLRRISVAGLAGEPPPRAP